MPGEAEFSSRDCRSAARRARLARISASESIVDGDGAPDEPELAVETERVEGAVARSYRDDVLASDTESVVPDCFRRASRSAKRFSRSIERFSYSTRAAAYSARVLRVDLVWSRDASEDEEAVLERAGLAAARSAREAAVDVENVVRVGTRMDDSVEEVVLVPARRGAARPVRDATGAGAVHISACDEAVLAVDRERMEGAAARSGRGEGIRVDDGIPERP